MIPIDNQDWGSLKWHGVAREIARSCLTRFGFLLWSAVCASNSPVDGVITTLPAIFNGFKSINGHCSPKAQLKVSFDNTVELYIERFSGIAACLAGQWNTLRRVSRQPSVSSFMAEEVE
jgi:hypothetical protein